MHEPSFSLASHSWSPEWPDRYGIRLLSEVGVDQGYPQLCGLTLWLASVTNIVICMDNSGV